MDTRTFAREVAELSCAGYAVGLLLLALGLLAARLIWGPIWHPSRPVTADSFVVVEVMLFDGVVLPSEMERRPGESEAAATMRWVGAHAGYLTRWWVFSGVAKGTFPRDPESIRVDGTFRRNDGSAGRFGFVETSTKGE
jgi:hypothetical protein